MRSDDKKDIAKSFATWGAIYGKPFPKDVLPVEKPKRKRTEKPKEDPTEHQIQCAVVKWWRHACGTYRLPAFALFAVPNGAHLASPHLMVRLKAEGLENGVPDLLLDVPCGQFHGLRLETKTRKGVLSSAQEDYRDYYIAAGYKWVIYRTPEDGIAAIKEYLK